MTWYGQPYVYRKDEIIVISPRNTAHILDALGFDELFEFCGPMKGVRIKDKKVMHYKDIFGDTRMARLQRIAMDLDIPLQEYKIKKELEKRAQARINRKKRIIAKQGLIIKEDQKIHMVCPHTKCGRRYDWQHPLYMIGRCPRWHSKITVEKIESGEYIVKQLETN